MALFSPEKIAPLKGNILRAIVETPRGSRGKFTWDEEAGLFKLTGILSLGMHFPLDFGFIPSTRGEDGDPLDVLVFCDAEIPTGCLVETRLIGCILGEQKEEGKKIRNDRFLAVELNSVSWKQVREISDLPDTLLDQLEHFFASYNEVKGKVFRSIGREGSRRALARLKRSLSPTE